MQEAAPGAGHIYQAESKWVAGDMEPVSSGSHPLSAAAVYNSGRSINASMSERSILLGVMAHNLGVLDSRENDTHTVFRKSQLWDEVTREFNNRTGTPRSRQQIQTLYKNMKAKARRYQARLAEVGIPPPEPDPNSEMLMALLQAQLQQQRTFLHNVTLGSENSFQENEQQFIMEGKPGVLLQNTMIVDDTHNGTGKLDNSSNEIKTTERDYSTTENASLSDDRAMPANPHQNSLLSQELESPMTGQRLTSKGICVDNCMVPNTNNLANEEVDKANTRINISKRTYDTLSNASDSDEGPSYINPHQIMQVCLKEEIPLSSVKIEPTDIDAEAQMVDGIQEKTTEDTQSTSDSHSDPLTVSEYKTLLTSDNLNLSTFASSPVKYNGGNIDNQINISPKSATNNKQELVGQNVSMVLNSLNSQKSLETVKNLIPSTSSTLSSGIKRSQPNLSFKRRRYSFCVDSGINNQQVFHAQGNAPKVCSCPEIHKELIKLEREESNLRCQLLEEERISCTKEHEARMRLIAMEEKLVHMQLRKLQSEFDAREHTSSEDGQNVDEQKNISIDSAHTNGNDLSSLKQSSSSNSKKRLQEVNGDSASKTNIFDTIYVS